jgi:hypothetical protein
MKFILGVIPIFWYSMPYIPKAILEKIKKVCFRFLWPSCKEELKIPLVKWKTIAKSKEEGGWALKGIHLFDTTLVAKSLWTTLVRDGLWKKIIEQKYVELVYFINWIRSPRKIIKNISN